MAIGMAMPLTTILVVKLSGGAAKTEPLKRLRVKKQNAIAVKIRFFITGISSFEN